MGFYTCVGLSKAGTGTGMKRLWALSLEVLNIMDETYKQVPSGLIPQRRKTEMRLLEEALKRNENIKLLGYPNYGRFCKTLKLFSHADICQEYRRSQIKTCKINQ